MAGARITLEIQDGEVQAALARLAGFAGPPLDLALHDVGEFLRIAHDQRFATETAPDGEPWAALSPRYKRRKDRLRPGVRKLVFDNFMHGTLRYQVGGGTLLFGTDRPYGAIHHFGGEITIHARSQQAYFRQDRRTGEVGSQFVSKRKSNFAQWVTLPEYKITIPARPWLGLSVADDAEVVAIVADHLRRQAEGG